MYPYLWHNPCVPFQDTLEVALAPLDNLPVLLSHVYAADLYEFVRPHDSYSSWTLLAPERGAIRVRLGGGSWETITEGMWIVCPPHIEFAREAVQTPFSFHFVHFEWDLDVESARTTIGRQSTINLDRLNQNLEDWRALESFTSRGAYLWRQHLLWDILGLAWYQEHTPALSVTDPTMLRARSLIKIKADSGISLGDVAAQLQLSPVALTRQFRAAFGVTPSQFLLGQRLDRARHLLISTELPLDTIAMRCGLGSGFYLSRVWSKQFGQSPSRFRRENQI